jgi:D-arabinose 1-dehydrogenase-like Zn-dependent alcohol dehydrogenase
VQYNKDYQLRNDIPVPKPGPREILIQIAAAGFCHTDYQVYEGAYKTELAHTGSHEPVGTIAALGSSVSGSWKIGDRVGAFLFREPCGKCNDCKWYAASHEGELNARYCDNKVMGGIRGADGGFAEYMITSDDAIVRIPVGVPFEQAAPLMCAGATVFTAIKETGLVPGQTLAVVGIGALGLLAIQFAKALGLRVAAIHHRDVSSKNAGLPGDLRADVFVDSSVPEAIDQISQFTDGIGLDAAVVCTDSVPITDWIAHRLHPRGVVVPLGLPEEGFHFDAFNVVFREIVIKGSLHSSVEEMDEMMLVVAKHDIRSQVSIVRLEEAEALPARVHAHEFSGKAVVVTGSF